MSGTSCPDSFDVVQEEEDAFWGLAVVEVLRHTGIRIEEMLELTQLDVHEYEHRDRAVGKVLLLHVNPSKQDRERMLVIAPELAAILASMARHIRNAVGGTESALPSVVLYDYAECQNSEPLPFFFQRTAGKGFKGTTRPITRGYVARVLGKVCAAAGLSGVDGNMIAFTEDRTVADLGGDDLATAAAATKAVATGAPRYVEQVSLEDDVKRLTAMARAHSDAKGRNAAELGGAGGHRLRGADGRAGPAVIWLSAADL